jgi:hypothetical protein
MIFEHWSKYRVLLIIVALAILVAGVFYFLFLELVFAPRQNISPEALPSSFKDSHQKQAIEDYLVLQEEFVWNTREDTWIFCSVENLQPENELFPFYVWAFCGEYTLENGQIKSISGSSLPAKINYANELSFYDFSRFSFEIPGDGSNYTTDIKRIFPNDTQEKIFGFNASHLAENNKITASKAITDWDEIKKAIEDCQVKEVFQSHSRDVVAKLKDGRELKSKERKIDDIIKVAQNAQPKCGKIIMATE